MKSKKVLLFLLMSGLIVAGFIIGCKKIDIERVADVKTQPVTNVTTSSVDASGEIIDLGEGSINAHGFCFSITDNPIFDMTSVNLGAVSKMEVFTSTISSLTPNTKYYLRSFITDETGISYGNTISFTTTGGAVPILSTLGITNITSNTAKGGGNITSDGGSQVTARGVCWSISNMPTIGNSHTTDGTGTGSFESQISGLNPSTLYYVRAYATNSSGTGYGAQTSFTTSGSGGTIPTVTTTGITNITSTAATGGGVVQSEGTSAVTARGVCWSTSAMPTISNSQTSDGSGPGTFESEITGLSANTEYFVRAYATNSSGTGYGAQTNFTTSAGASYWLGYDDGTNYTGIGFPTGDGFDYAIRIPTGNLTEYDGYKISKIAFYPTATAEFYVELYDGVNGSNLVYYEEVTNPIINTWNQYSPTNEYIIDKNIEIWIGIWVLGYTAGTYPAGCDDGPAIDGFGDMISVDGGETWESLHAANPDLNYNWNLQVFVTNQKGEEMQVVPNQKSPQKIKTHKTTFILMSLFFISLNSLYAQSAAKIENIKFDAEGSKLAITYDIAKFKEGETFEIWVKIVTVSGKTIVPVTMYGDVNKGVSGGTGKRIVWDVEADNAALDEEFTVEVYGKSDGKSSVQGVKEPAKEKPEKVKGQGFSVGKALALSAILPGLGNRAVKGSGAQWLLGVAGYGCIVGSVVLNRSAYNAYEDYKLADNPQDRDDYFSKAESNDKISRYLIYGAAAIWVTDLVWTGLQAGKSRKNTNPKVSFNYYYDSNLNEPMFGLNYRF